MDWRKRDYYMTLRRTFFALACLSLACGTRIGHAQYAPPPGQVAAWLTTGDAAHRLEHQPNLVWAAARPAADAAIVVDPKTQYQTIEGYGASLVEPAIWKANPSVRAEIMTRLFSRTQGIGLNVLRVPMGDLDVGGQGTTYDDMPAGQTDPTLAHFSIAADEAWKIPFVREAKRLNPELEVIGTPWSAPAWMKDTDNLGKGRLKPEYYPVYADYFRRWIAGWKAHGIAISAVTFQNEPHNEPGWYQGMRMEPADEAALAKQLGPKLQEAGLKTRLWCWDHNWDEPDYPIKVLSDPEAAKWIEGSAFHGYAGDPPAMSRVHDAFPNKSLYFTEITGSYSKGDDGPQGFGGSLMWQVDRVVAAGARNWSRMGLLWKIGIAEAKPIAAGGDRPITRVAPDGGSYEFEGEYYVLGHASKFVRPGARRIDSTQTGQTMTVAFRNPNGSNILIVYQWGPRRTFTVEDRGRFFASELPENSVETFVWRDAPSGR